MRRTSVKILLSFILSIVVLTPITPGVTQKKEPTVMVIIPEMIINHRTPDPAVETAIIHELVEKGFKVIDEKQIDKIRDKRETKCALEGNEKCIMNVASKFKADILILGEAFAEDTGTTQGLQTVRARAEVRVVKTEDAVLLGSKGVQVGASDLAIRIAGKKGLQRAGKRVSAYVVNQLAKHLNREKLITNRSKIIEVSRISFSDISSIKDTLRRVEGIDGFVVKKFFPPEGRVLMKIDTSIKPYELADLLINIEYDSFQLQLSSISTQENNTVLKLKKVIK